MTLVVLALMALLVLKFTAKSTPTAPALAAPSAAAIATCQAGVTALNQAISDFRALIGHAPPPGTTWATGAAQGGPYIQAWPGLAHTFTIHWNGHVLRVTTPRGAGCARA